MGNVYDGSFNMDISGTFAKQNIYTRPACRQCWARFYCSGGCSASNLLVNGDITKSNEVACEMERKRLECAIALNAIAAGMGEKDNTEGNNTISSIDDVIAAKDELVKASKEFSSFTGKGEEMDGSVKFIMKTDEVKIEDKAKEEKKEVKEEKKGFFAWLKSLIFGED